MTWKNQGRNTADKDMEAISEAKNIVSNSAGLELRRSGVCLPSQSAKCSCSTTIIMRHATVLGTLICKQPEKQSSMQGVFYP